MTLVSAAKIMGKEKPFNNFGKSFIYKRNSKGPGTYPGKTPSLVLSQSNAVLFASIIYYSSHICYLNMIHKVRNHSL
jgi:hypothetical protein